jgi:hypothetical protein
MIKKIKDIYLQNKYNLNLWGNFEQKIHCFYIRFIT